MDDTPLQGSHLYFPCLFVWYPFKWDVIVLFLLQRDRCTAKLMDRLPSPAVVWLGGESMNKYSKALYLHFWDDKCIIKVGSHKISSRAYLLLLFYYESLALAAFAAAWLQRCALSHHFLSVVLVWFVLSGSVNRITFCSFIISLRKACPSPVQTNTGLFWPL